MHADSLSRKPNAADPSPEEQVTVDVMFMGPLQLGSHMVQNRQTGEQMTHWKIQIWCLCLTCPSASFGHQFGDFVPRDCSAAKGPLEVISL